MVITSSDNSKIVQVKKLSEKKFRSALGLYVIEGVRLVSDAIVHGAQIEEIFVRESFAENPFDVQTVVADRVFDKISSTVSDQGVLAVVRKNHVDMCAPTGNCLVLDGVQDPGNAGTLLRTAAACGFSDVYAANSVDMFSPKVLRSAMSAHFCVKLHETSDIPEVFRLLRDVTVVAADMKGENVFHAQFAGKTALVLGNEGNGLSQYAREHVHKTVSLPMANNFESLNVAVAGSVIMYQIFSQNI